MWLDTPLNAQPFQLYRIGNSHSATAASSGTLNNWHRATTGQGLREGYHIRCGQPLSYIYDFPDETCVGPPHRGTWPNALNNYNDWNALVFQPSIPSTLADSNLNSDVWVISRWIKIVTTNGADPVFFVMQAPPPVSQNHFDVDWFQPVANSLQTPTTNAHEYYQHLLDRLLARNRHAQIYLIPASDIYSVVGRRLQQTPVTIDGMVYDNAWDLYRDAVHGNKYGAYSSGLAIYASLFPMTRQELDHFDTVNSGFRYGPESIWTAELYEIIRDAVYECLQNVPHARPQH
jgi:hypothetical protein